MQAGQAVDDTIKLLSQFMGAGDVIIDGGNEWFPNSVRYVSCFPLFCANDEEKVCSRSQELSSLGIMYVGMGISGGEEGARHGPSLMPGGPAEAYDMLAPIWNQISAQTKSGGPCVTNIGPIGSGNYVKMVHNGIEYGDMQLIAETYDILKHAAGLTNEELAQVFLDRIQQCGHWLRYRRFNRGVFLRSWIVTWWRSRPRYSPRRTTCWRTGI